MTLTEKETYTCPHCGGTGVTGTHYPQALRLLDAKGRFTIPFAGAARTYQPELRGATVWFVPDERGTAHLVPAVDGYWRLTIPAEFRQALGLKPGDDVALARENGAILCWKHES